MGTGPITSWCLTMADLRRMTEAQFRKAKKLIRALCANFDNGNCLLLDDGYDPHVCPQSISYSLLCKYFRAAVLPADRELFVEIMKSDGLRRCAECGAAFAAESKNALYCKACAAQRTRRKKREWAQKSRGRA